MERLDSLIGSRSSHPAPEVKGYFDFHIGPASSVELPTGDLSNKDFRIATNMRVLSLIANALAQQGILTDQPQVDKFGLVACSAKFKNCSIRVMLGARSREKSLHFEMITFMLNIRGQKKSRIAAEEWQLLCDKIEEILTTKLKATSLQRLAKA
jgi:hypothetical protein